VNHPRAANKQKQSSKEQRTRIQRFTYHALSIYALERITKESETHYWPIVKILTAYVRQHASQRNGEAAMPPEQWPSLDPDIEAIIAVLRERTRSYGHGEPSPLDLHGTALRYANFRAAHLRKVDLRKTLLEKADLSAADLSAADLSEALMGCANLKGATLLGANLSDANGATILRLINPPTDFSEANLRGTSLQNALMM
jgi:hypothetical protein